MNTKTQKTAGRACAADLQSLAAQGVERALAARMTELSAEQTQAVSGAAYVFIKGPLINGIVNPEIYKALQQGVLTQPTLPAGTLNTGNILVR